MIKIILNKRKKPIPEFEQLAQAKDNLKKEIFLFFEAARLKIHYELILAIPAKEIKKMKLRQIIKEMKSLKTKREE